MAEEQATRNYLPGLAAAAAALRIYDPAVQHYQTGYLWLAAAAAAVTIPIQQIRKMAAPVVHPQVYWEQDIMQEFRMEVQQSADSVALLVQVSAPLLA